MADLLQPMHLAVLAIMAVIFYLVVRSVGPAVVKAALPKPTTQEWVDPSLPVGKQCRGCGEQIAKQADNCPFCGQTQPMF